MEVYKCGILLNLLNWNEETNLHTPWILLKGFVLSIFSCNEMYGNTIHETFYANGLDVAQYLFFSFLCSNGITWIHFWTSQSNTSLLKFNIVVGAQRLERKKVGGWLGTTIFALSLNVNLLYLIDSFHTRKRMMAGW